MPPNDDQNDFPHRQLLFQHHQEATLVSQVVTSTSSAWSDDDSGKYNDYDNDNTWLVTTSASSSTVSDQSMYSDDEDDDENDVETDRTDTSNICTNNGFGDTTSVVWKKNEKFLFCRHQQQSHGDEPNVQLQLNVHPTFYYSEEQIRIQQNRCLDTASNTIHGYLRNYSEFISQAKHQETILKLFQWSLWLIGVFIVPSYSTNRLLPQWIQKLSYDVCYARYVTRLLGLPVALEGAMSGSWATTCFVQQTNQSLDTTYRIIGHLLAYSMVAYYPVEHVAFFLWMNPNAETILNKPAETWFYISMRCWLLYLVVEMFQCALKFIELRQYQTKLEQSKKTDLRRDDNNMNPNTITRPPQQHCVARDASPSGCRSYENRQQTHHHSTINNRPDRTTICSLCNNEGASSSNNDITPMKLHKEIFNVRLLLIRNLFYIGPCIHWSMSTWDTQPILSDVVLNGLMWIESILCLYQAIYNSSE